MLEVIWDPALEKEKITVWGSYLINNFTSFTVSEILMGYPNRKVTWAGL